MRRRLRYWGQVFARAIHAAGWAAGIATVIFGGSVLTASGFLFHYQHRTLAVALLAGLFLLAILEGSYRTWNVTDAALQAARLRLGALDTAEAKRAYLDEQIARGERLKEQVASVVPERWISVRDDYWLDIASWETGIRQELRSFDSRLADLFMSDDGFDPPGSPLEGVVGSRDAEVIGLDRRIARLRQINEQL